MLELGQSLLNFSRIVTGGIVVFLPSYRTLALAMKVWTDAKIVDQLQRKKKVCTLISQLTICGVNF